MVVNNSKIMVKVISIKLPSLQTSTRSWEVSQQHILMVVCKLICCRPMKKCFSIRDSRQRLSRKITRFKATKAYSCGLALGLWWSQLRSCILVYHSFKLVSGALTMLNKINNIKLMESGLTAKLSQTCSRFLTQESQWPNQFSRTAFLYFAW